MRPAVNRETCRFESCLLSQILCRFVGVFWAVAKLARHGALNPVMRWFESSLPIHSCCLG